MLAAVTLAAFLAQASVPADPGLVPPMPDYSAATSWFCRPEAPGACAIPLDETVVDAQGAHTSKPFTPAADPKVDCFYVYPTASSEKQFYSDMKPTAGELASLHDQFARFASRCRLFAPAYRQLTAFGLQTQLRAGKTEFDWSIPYQDVRAAWRFYLAHDNHGRGVILIGHSQGTILLSQLIAEEIDGKPVSQRIVAAYLGGHPGLAGRDGKAAGEAFTDLPLCRTQAQLRCTLVFSTYAVDDPTTTPLFGRNASATRLAGCTNPAAPAGGRTPLKAIFAKAPTAPASDPPFTEFDGGLTGECVSDPKGALLRVTVDPGPNEAAIKAALNRQGLANWGLHFFDMMLVQGDLLDETEAKLAAWNTGRR